MNIVRSVSEGAARRTSRRGVFGRGAQLAAGALIGVAAGGAARSRQAAAGLDTVCVPPMLCACEHCQSNGVCAKPCVITTMYYPSGCWVVINGVTCCDCVCPGLRRTSGGAAAAPTTTMTRRTAPDV
jgi:hypothetical protein